LSSLIGFYFFFYLSFLFFSSQLFSGFVSLCGSVFSFFLLVYFLFFFRFRLSIFFSVASVGSFLGSVHFEFFLMVSDGGKWWSNRLRLARSSIFFAKLIFTN